MMKGLEGVGEEGMDMQVGTLSRVMPVLEADDAMEEDFCVSGVTLVSDSSSAMGWNRKSLEIPPHIEAEVQYKS